MLITAPAIADAPLDASSTTALIRAAAVKYGLNYDHFYRTLRCESGLNTNAIGDHGTSFGVAQIHLPAHPDITRQEAMNGRWSIEWAAEQFATGGAPMWSCYHILFM